VILLKQNHFLCVFFVEGGGGGGGGGGGVVFSFCWGGGGGGGVAVCFTFLSILQRILLERNYVSSSLQVWDQFICHYSVVT